MVAMIETTCKLERYDEHRKDDRLIWVESTNRDGMVTLNFGDYRAMILGKDLQRAVENCVRTSAPSIGFLGQQVPVPFGQGLQESLTERQKQFFRDKATGCKDDQRTDP